MNEVHYRIGGKLTHCGVEILPNGKDIPYIVIKEIKFHESHNVGGTIKENVWVAYFADNPFTKLPMLLNSTNRKRIAKQFGAPYLERVKDFPVRLTQEKTRDVQDGGETMGLRISRMPAKMPTPAKRESVTMDSPLMSNCIDFINNGGNIADIKVKYDMTSEVESAILSACKKKEDK